MADWCERPLKQCLDKFGVNRQHQVKASDIKANGRFPVIDQGKAFIAGFTDEADKVISTGLPVIVFGDHTRCFKFVDFPFVLGADGTKVLKPKDTLLDAKYFYFACRGLEIPDRGYNRHFTLLKDMPIRFPADLALQRSIANLLSHVEAQIDYNQRKALLHEELLAALVRDVVSGALDTSTLTVSNPPDGQAENASELS